MFTNTGQINIRLLSVNVTTNNENSVVNWDKLLWHHLGSHRGPTKQKSMATDIC